MPDCSEQTEEATRRHRIGSVFTAFHRFGPFGRRPAVLWLLVVLCAHAGIGLSVLLPVVFGEGCGFAPALAGVLLVPLVLHAGYRLARQQYGERASLTEAVLDTCSDWLWAVGADGRFTYSSSSSRELLGYEPSELLGQHWTAVADLDALGTPWTAWRDFDGSGTLRTAPVAIRHRDGKKALVEVRVSARLDGAGQNVGYTGSVRLVETVGGIAVQEVRGRIAAVLANRTILTAFQPICRLDTGDVVGVEALTRFTCPPAQSPEAWFADAAAVGYGPELEFLAIETALDAAAGLPAHLYVSVNLSPQACLDPLLTDILQNSQVAPGRIVLELTERAAVTDYEHLRTALSHPREAGVRIAVDDACAGFASMQHILQLKPDLIKLDRDIVAGMDANHAQRILAAAMLKFATGIGAALIAEGIETDTELAAVTGLGINTGQGYLLGQPSVHPEEWRHWQNQASNTGNREFPVEDPGGS